MSLRPGDELGAVVDNDACRQPALAGELLEPRDDAGCRQGGIRLDPRAFTRELIDDGEAAKASAIDTGIVNKLIPQRS